MTTFSGLPGGPRREGAFYAVNPQHDDLLSPVC